PLPEQSTALLQPAIQARFTDKDARVRLGAIVAAAYFPLERGTASALAQLYPGLDDPWSRSAVAGVAAKNPLLFLETAADSAKSDAFRELASQLAGQAASRQSGEYAAQFVVMLAAKPASADALKRAVLEKFSKELKREVVAPWSGELQSAFQK